MKVTVIDLNGNEAAVPFTWAGPFTINLSAPAPTGHTVRIRRVTPVDTSIVDFSGGAILNEANLDKANRQALLAAADAADTGLIAADEVRREVTSGALLNAATVAALIAPVLAPTFKGAKGDKGDKGDPGTNGTNSTVPGPTGPAPSLAIGNVTNIATGGAATAALRPNGTGAYLLDLGLPIGATGSGASVSWGGIGGSLASQTDLVAALAGKQAAGSYALTSHNHDSTYAPISHTHTIAQVTGLQAALDAKLGVSGDGGTEIGNYLDFHSPNADGVDYRVRLQALSDGSGGYQLNVGASRLIVGTDIMASQPYVTSALTAYMPKAGGTFTGNITVQGDMTVRGPAGSNAQYSLRDEAGVAKALFYWVRSDGTVRFRRYKSDGSGTAEGELTLGSGNATLSYGLTVQGNINCADIYATRGDRTGVIFLGDQSGGSRYVYYDGTNYIMPGANLSVGQNIGGAEITASGSLWQQGGKRVPVHTVSTADPSGGTDGDVWIKVA